MTKYDLSNQSKELTEFYVAYAFWLAMDAPPDPCFTRYSGLCIHLIGYYENKGIECRVRDEMHQQFVDAGLHGELPFNRLRCDEATQHKPSYSLEADRDVSHLNEERVAWVLDHIPSAGR